MNVTADPSFASLYDQLRQIAQSALRRSGAHLALSPTTLLHEAYLDISRRQSLQFPDRAHFMAYASRAMRGLIIDYARERRAQKRGGGFDITAAAHGRSRPAADVGELQPLSDALDELATVDAALAELVDLKFFCGFSFAEVAAMRSTSERTVRRDWSKARLYLHDSCRQRKSRSLSYSLNRRAGANLSRRAPRPAPHLAHERRVVGEADVDRDFAHREARRFEQPDRDADALTLQVRVRRQTMDELEQTQEVILRHVRRRRERRQVDAVRIVAVQEIGRTRDAAVDLATRGRADQRQLVDLIEQLLLMGVHAREQNGRAARRTTLRLRSLARAPAGSSAAPG